MAIQTISTAYNPISGVFGTGQVQMYFASGTWSVPPGIGKVRARVWGGGGHNGGSGGGFSMEAIYDLTGVTSVAVTVGAGGNAGVPLGGTSSFGSYCSATGGAAAGGAIGVGSGGDINNSGGAGANGCGGGGSASLIGNGGGNTQVAGTGGAGAGSNGSPGGIGFLGIGGKASSNTLFPPTSGLQQFSIDFIGTGGGGFTVQNGINGGGGGSITNFSCAGGIPGGGGGLATSGGNGGQGLVIVEW
jgi:hypothetical protein